MDWFWNWGGECFGYRDGESLSPISAGRLGDSTGRKYMEATAVMWARS
jgi:hypothetical protein